MYRIKKSFMIAILLMLYSGGLLSRYASGYFLDGTQGVRPSGLGDAFVAVADDANALLFNPAGITRIPDFEFSGMYSSLYSNLNVQTYSGQNDHAGYQYAAALIPGSAALGSFGLSWTQLTSAIYHEQSLALAYARRLVPIVPLDWGVNLKFLQWSVASNEFTAGPDSLFPDLQKRGFTADFGLLFTPFEGFNLGLGLMNGIPADLGLTVSEIVSPILRAGAAYTLQLNQANLDSLLTSAEVDYGDEIVNPKLGFELWFWNRHLAVRTGVNRNAAAAGFSFRYAWPDFPLILQLDYAADYRFNVLDTVGGQRIGIDIRWAVPGLAAVSRVLARNDKLAQIEGAGTSPAAESRSPLTPLFSVPSGPRSWPKISDLNSDLAGASELRPQSTQVESQSGSNPAGPSPDPGSFQALHTPANQLVVGIESGLLSDYDDIPIILEKFQIIERQLEKETGLRIVPHIFYKPNELRDAFDQGGLDAIITSSGISKQLYAQGAVTPFVTVLVNGQDSQRFCLFVRGDSPITQLDQIKGKRLGYLGVESPDELKDCFFKNVPGFSPDRYFKESKQMTNARGSIVVLQINEVDVIAGFEYLLSVEKSVGINIQKGMRAIATSESVPNVPVFINCRLDGKKREQLLEIKRKLLQFHKTPSGAAVLRDFNIDQFVPFQEKKYKFYLQGR